MKLVVALLFLVNLGYAQTLLSRTQLHMGTFVKLSLPLTHQELFNPAFEIVKTMDETFSTYKKSAYAYRLNVSKSLEVPKVFIELLHISKKLYEQTFGYFSIAVGTITKKRYFFGQKEARIPSNKELDSSHTDTLGFHINKQKVILDKDVTVDFGGIAKGFTVDKLHDFLERKGVKEFQIALSGDIYCKGTCRIAIQSPFEKDGAIKLLTLNDTAISTSGNYERYIKSVKHNHLINPKTKRAQQKIASMTLYSKVYDNTTLDALATALSVMPHEIRVKVLNKFPKISYLYITVDKKQYESQSKE